ncbi:DMT family transporter [Halodesulfovibrio sp.]|jgi:drug/metabolite transporter (DMT)-like permease|uniref:DMT family transporter n=1 Tax=Halodesulfovibrio sp. TaxID=1912772 RepID=UPI0025ED982A|nr:DMT family transporter [Halodesulfovibrio sp.]MCT4626381.1 DMT family transporter [Halodesulfovibrio sp.]
MLDRFQNILKGKVAGYCYIILAIANFSGNIVAARAMGDVMPPSMLNLYRWTLATLIVLPFVAKPMWRERHLLKKHFVTLCALALLGLTLFDLFLFIAGQTTSALNIALISTLSPLLTAVVARVFIGEKSTLATYVGCVISMIGVAYLVTHGNLSQLANIQFGRGDLFVICTCVMSAIYNSTVKVVSEKISQLALLGSMFILGVAFLFPIFLWDVYTGVEMVEVTSNMWMILTYLAIGASILCYFFWNLAVEIIGATRTTQFYYVIPLASGFLAYIFLGEPVSETQLYGGAVIFAGILLSMMSGSPKKQTPQEVQEEEMAGVHHTPASQHV